MQHERYIRQCYDLAVSAGKKGYDTFGALLVHDGKIIETAENTAGYERGFFGHAEFNLVHRCANRYSDGLLRESVLYTSFFRLIAFPVMIAFMLKPFGLDPMVMNICVILLAMPVAANTAAMAERYDGDYKFASAVVSVSTLLSVVTVPVITWFIQMI